MDRSVVDEAVDPAELAKGEGDDRVPVGGHRDVVVVEAGRFTQVVGDAASEIVEHIGEDDLRPLGHEETSVGLAHATGGAGHDGDLAVEPDTHDPSI